MGLPVNFIIISIKWYATWKLENWFCTWGMSTSAEVRAVSPEIFLCFLLMTYICRIKKTIHLKEVQQKAASPLQQIKNLSGTKQKSKLNVNIGPSEISSDLEMELLVRSIFIRTFWWCSWETVNHYLPKRMGMSAGCLVRCHSFRNPFLTSFASVLWTGEIFSLIFSMKQ